MAANDMALYEGVIALARDAATKILEVYESEFAVQRKDDRSPLTAADLASHHCIVAGLERLAPEVPILSEESAEDVPAVVRREWRTLWLVDPLDGTREFIKRNGEFTVNIALIEDGLPVFGVVQQPTTGALWWGARGRGAFKRDGDVDAPMHVRAPAAAPWRVAASRSHRDERTEAFMARMGEVEPVGVGSSLKFCMLAEGAMDVYPRFGPTSEWDTAAAQCVLEAAGGAVLDPRGRPLAYNQRDTILNGDFIALGDTALPWKDWLDG
jgi:3'(2'), 5'-bisphosphate nucleotidase